MRETDYLKENKHVLALLKRIGKFQNFSDEDLHSFMKIGKLREYDPGEMIVKKGDTDRWAYFLISGEVKIVKGGETLGILNRGGDLFGEMGVVDGGPRSATVWARTKTMVLGVDCSVLAQEEINNGIAFLYTIYRLFAEVLAERLRITTDEVTKLKSQLELEKKGEGGEKGSGDDDKTLWV
ncbi:MAG: cyclic nucleotide-binding domain-containing protein [Desulfobulbaceae bacterium]|nr:cyclic nucleotide-binding domain-containing protein [Desulfobulbaceae bacterium]